MACLEGKVAVVTGASRGIGRSAALKLATAGAKVALVARTMSALQEVAAECGEGGYAYSCDLTRDEDIRDLTNQLVTTFGRIDVVVHSAGIIAGDRIENSTLSDLDAQYLANLRGPYALTQCLLPHLLATRGQIIFVNSSIVRAASIAGRGQFAATQHAFKALADSLRDEVNDAGVRVTSIFPGTTATPRQMGLHSKMGRVYRPERLLQPDDVAQVILAALSLSDTAEVTEIYLRPRLKPLP